LPSRSDNKVPAFAILFLKDKETRRLQAHRDKAIGLGKAFALYVNILKCFYGSLSRAIHLNCLKLIAL